MQKVICDGKRYSTLALWTVGLPEWQSSATDTMFYWLQMCARQALMSANLTHALWPMPAFSVFTMVSRHCMECQRQGDLSRKLHGNLTIEARKLLVEISIADLRSCVYVHCIRCTALPCPALPCPFLPCPASTRPDQNCPALNRPMLSCPTLPYTFSVQKSAVVQTCAALESLVVPPALTLQKILALMCALPCQQELLAQLQV